MAISAFNFATGNIVNSSGPLAVAYGTNNTSGNLLVASFWAVNFSGISDSQGNTWVNLFTSSYTVSTAHQYIYYVLSAKPGANTVTLSFSGAGSYSALVILEASGGTWSVDGTATGAASSGTSLSSGAMTTTGTNDLLISGTYNSSAFATTPGTGWTVGDTDANNGILQYQIVTSAGSYTATATLSSSASGFIDIGAFTASGGGGPISPTGTGSMLVTGTANPQLAAIPTGTGSMLLSGVATPVFNPTMASGTGTMTLTGVAFPTISGGGGGGGAPLPYAFWGGGHS